MSIFDNEANKVSSNWMQWQNVGDKIEGTFVDKRKVFNKLSGVEQSVYELKTKEGEYWNVGGKAAIDAQMNRVKLGQIIGFEYVEERPNKTPGLNATKVIQVWANPKDIDQEWLDEQKELNTTEQQAEETPKNDIPTNSPGFFDNNKKTEPQETSSPQVSPSPTTTAPQTTPDTTPVQVESSTQDNIKKITEIAQNKWGLSDPNEVKNKVMEITNLAFIENNLDEIVKKLEAI